MRRRNRAWSAHASCGAACTDLFLPGVRRPRGCAGRPGSVTPRNGPRHEPGTRCRCARRRVPRWTRRQTDRRHGCAWRAHPCARPGLIRHHHQRAGLRDVRSTTGCDESRQRLARVRAPGRRAPRDGGGQRRGRLPDHVDRQRDADAHGTQRRAPGGHGRDERTDCRPADVEHRRRRPLRPGRQRASGREQPGSGDHPRQQLLGRLLRQRGAGRRAVLPRPVQPRSRRGAEGAERARLRTRRRRRRDQPRHQRGDLPPIAPVHVSGRKLRQQAVHARSRPARHGHRGAATERDVRELRQLPRQRRSRARRRQPDADVLARQEHEDDSRVRVPERHSCRRPRDHLLSGTSGGCRSIDVLRQPGRQPRARGGESRHGVPGASHRQRDYSDAHDDRRL